MKRLTLLLFLFALTTTYAQDGIYLFGTLNGSQGEPVEMTATIYSEPAVVVDFSTTAEGDIEIFWVPLPGPDWSHLAVDFTNCQGLDVTTYVANDSLQPLVDVYLNLDYCSNDTIWGCTDVNALNFDPLANSDDGSCIYTSVPNDHCADAIPLSPGTMIIDNTGATNTGDIWGACWGFGNGEAEQNSLWYSFTTPDVPASIHIGTYSDATYTLTDTQIGVFETCGGEMIYCDGNSGPNLFAALDFECGTLAENTTYIVMIDGWNGDSGSCMLNFTVDTACTEIPGCTDPTALNYNPAANVNDGSCEYDDPCEGTQVYFSYAFSATGDTTQFVIWEITNSTGETVASGADNWQQASYPFCLEDGCYTFTVDSVPPSWEGYFSISGLGVDGSWVPVDGSSTTYSLSFAINDPDCFGTTEIYGCTDPEALNYNPVATMDDNSCFYECADPGCEVDVNSAEYLTVISNDPFCCNNTWDGICQNAYEALDGMPNPSPDCEITGCTDPEALNYDPEATSDDGSCTYPSDCNDVVLVYDYYGWTDSVMTSWTLENFDGGYASFGIFNPSDDFPELCVPDGCYNLTLNNPVESFGGMFSVNFAGETLFFEDFDGSQGSFVYTFGINATGCDSVIDVSGCTDPEALNYNPNATTDDGSCVYNSTCSEIQFVFDFFTWTDSTGIIWSLADVDGTFETFGYVNGPVYIGNACLPDGCYELTLHNMEENAGGVLSIQMQDSMFILIEEHSGVAGSYTYTFGLNSAGCDETVEISGCTDPEAMNYNPDATIDNGNCVYFNTDCEIEFLIVPDSLGENVIWVVTNFDPNSTISVLWDFGDGNTTTEWYPSHTYADEGPYTLCVTVVIGEPANAECAASFCMEVDGGMIGSGLVSSGFTINVIDGSTLVSNSDIERDFDLRLWPNPANENIQLQFASEMGSNSVLRIFDLTGKAVYATNLATSPGANTFEIDLNGLESGIYTMELMGEEGRWVEKFVVGK